MTTTIRSAAVAGLVLVLAATVRPAGAQESRVFPFDYDRVRLENGFTAYLIDAGAPGQIAFVTMVRTGSRDEVEPGKSGFAHFFEHMMFRGTEKYPDYDGMTSRIGAARNAFTSSDMTVYYLVASNEYLETIMDLESDRFQNLRYSEADFRTEAGAILGEYQQGALTPGRWLNEKVRETAFLEHTYRHTTIGFEADVRAMPEGYDYSLDFYRRFYRPENVVLVIAGDFDRSAAREMVSRYYGDWAPGYVPPAITPEPPQAEPRERTVQYPARTLPILSVNYKAPAWSATDTLAVAAEVLGRVAFGPNSELSRRLVLQERRLNSLNAGFGLDRDPGLLSITAIVNNPADVAAVESEISRTAARFHQELADETLLRDIKSNMKYGFLMGLETAQDVAFSTIPFVINTGGVEAVEDYFRTLDAVTPEHVRRAARQFLIDSGRTTITMVQAEG
jgi:zinc protease